MFSQSSAICDLRVSLASLGEIFLPGESDLHGNFSALFDFFGYQSELLNHGYALVF